MGPRRLRNEEPGRGRAQATPSTRLIGYSADPADHSRAQPCAEDPVDRLGHLVQSVRLGDDAEICSHAVEPLPEGILLVPVSGIPIGLVLSGARRVGDPQLPILAREVVRQVFYDRRHHDLQLPSLAGVPFVRASC